MIKLFAMDLDGTLLNSQSKFSKRTIHMIESLKERHAFIVIASGRTYREIMKIIKPLDLMEYDRAYIISYNGVLTTRCFPFTLFDRKMLSPSEIKEIVSSIDQDQFSVHIFSENKIYVSEGIKYVIHDPQDTTVIVKPILVDQHEFRDDSYKILIFDQEEKLNQLKVVLQTQIGSSYNVFKSSKQLLEIVHIDGSKGKALRRLMEIIGVSKEEAIAFGDEENDLSLMEATGIFVAMGNAHEHVKKQAKYATLSNDFDGVAEYIQNNIT